MGLARVVSFEGVSADRMAEMKDEMQGDQPEGLDVKEFLVLHDAGSEKSIAILFFDSEDAYQQGDAILDAMPAGETPGRRTSVEKYDVAVRMTR
jgi:hypothetical protein